jgi:transposase-like protein
MAKNRKRSDWRRIVKDYRKSGLSQSEFAKRRGLNQSSLSRWVGQFPEVEVEGSEPAPVFTELVAIDEEKPIQQHEDGRSEVVTIRLGEVSLEMPSLPPPEYLALVAKAYEAVQSC